jgi:hypothetical protein
MRASDASICIVDAFLTSQYTYQCNQMVSIELSQEACIGAAFAVEMVSFMVSVPALFVAGVALVGADIYSTIQDKRQRLQEQQSTLGDSI